MTALGAPVGRRPVPAPPSPRVTTTVRFVANPSAEVSGPGTATPTSDPVGTGTVGSDPTPKHRAARTQELSFTKPWVANLSTVLIALGVLLVLLAVVSRL